MDASRFRQRLIGAFILMVLAVIFLPMILSGRDDARLTDTMTANGQGAMKTMIMSLDNRHRVTEVKVIGGKQPVLPSSNTTAMQPSPVTATQTGDSNGAVGSVPLAGPVVAQTPSAAPADGVTLPEHPPVTDAAKAQSQDLPAASNQAEPVARAWIVQAGSFTDENNAKQLHTRIAQKGFASLLVKLELEGKTIYKVRLGPFEEERAAQEMAQQLSGAGFQCKVKSIRRWKK